MEVVYVYIFGDGVPHLHLHLAPHRPGDALNDQMIRGEIVEEKLAQWHDPHRQPRISIAAARALARRWRNGFDVL